MLHTLNKNNMIFCGYYLEINWFMSYTLDMYKYNVCTINCIYFVQSDSFLNVHCSMNLITVVWRIMQYEGNQNTYIFPKGDVKYKKIKIQ